MDLTKIQKRLLLKPWTLAYLFGGLAVVIGLAYAALNLTRTSRPSAVEPELGGLLSHTVMPADLYLLAHRSDGFNSLLRLDPESERVEQIYQAHGGSAMVATRDKQRVYVYDEARPIPQGSLSLVDAQDRAVIWEVKVPSFPWVGPLGQGAWLSTNEKRIYLLGTGDDLHHLHIYTFDTQTAALIGDFELKLPYPANEFDAAPVVWKLPWAETLIVACRDQLFSVDLTSVSSGTPMTPFRPDDIGRVPLNLPHTLYVMDDDLEPQSRRLFLATSGQQILSVDLTAEPITIDTVFSLPPDWQFAGFDPLAVDARNRGAYVQVKREDTPIKSGLEVEEIWMLDMTQWTQVGRLNFREHGPFLQTGTRQPAQPMESYPEGFGLAWSEGEGRTLFLTQRGLLSLGRGPGQELDGRWVAIDWGGIPEPFWYTVLP
jgi:hypothetical protein